MMVYIKKGAIILLAFFAFGKMYSQTGKVLYMDSLVQQEPIIMFDTTDFAARVWVDDTTALNQDSIFGDLFYWYLTDSMLAAGAPARAINNDTTNIWIIHYIIDIISVDIRPDEIKTTPVNLIILWPAMITSTPQVADSDSVAIYVQFEGYIGIPEIPDVPQSHLLFPTPALQYIYIRPEELPLIQYIHLLTIDGKMVSQYQAEEFSSGLINLDQLANGNYLVEVQYYSGKTVRTKILKR
jgi:hypothetical protein